MAGRVSLVLGRVPHWVSSFLSNTDAGKRVCRRSQPTEHRPPRVSLERDTRAHKRGLVRASEGCSWVFETRGVARDRARRTERRRKPFADSARPAMDFQLHSPWCFTATHSAESSTCVHLRDSVCLNVRVESERRAGLASLHTFLEYPHAARAPSRLGLFLAPLGAYVLQQVFAHSDSNDTSA